MGGPGYDGSADGCGPSAGGLGGIDLSEHISGSRMFFGGGGGGGQQNNNVATVGGNGGGIIFIRSGEIETASCAGFAISASGESSANAGNDGAGGSGAGGSILLKVPSWDLGCNLTIRVNGGAGGAVGDGAAHGGGGGGGKGVILFSGMAPMSNVTLENSQGQGGANSNNASSGTADEGEDVPEDVDADPDGIVEEEESPLPVELLYWKSEIYNEQALLRWATATELNNDYFTIEKSLDNKLWTKLVVIQGAGTTNEPVYYDYLDEKAFSQTVYYRLSQTDYDGTTEVFETITLKSKWAEENIVLYPNPNQGSFRLKFDADHFDLNIFDAKGQEFFPEIKYVGDELHVTTQHIPLGVYYVRLILENSTHTFRAIVE